MDSRQQPSVMPIALAIVFSGLVIAYSIYSVFAPLEQTIIGQNGQEIELEPLSDNDHILGDPDAPVVIVEYADLDDPYSRILHATMKQVMSTYGVDGKVAWVFRHFPLVELHPNAPKLAEASECVAEISGNEAFWKFVDSIYTADSPNERFELDTLDAAAASAGVPVGEFRECYESGRHSEKVAAQFDGAVAAGGVGTPYSIIVGPSPRPVPVSGSQPYSTIRSIVETLLADS